MKILVTGGAGFIASHIVDRYLQLGHQVAVIDNLSTGRRENLNPAASFYEVDITDADHIAEVFEAERPQIVNHHAAQMDVRRSVDEPVFDAHTNVIGSLNVIGSALQVGVEKIIYASTGGAIYGELDYSPADEDHPIRPLSPYGISKHAVEHYLYLYQHLEGLNFTVLRYANVYGPRQNPHGEAGVVAIFGKQMLAGQQATIFGDGTDTRDYVFVGDVVKANQLALEAGSGQIFNISTGVAISVQEIFDTVAEASGYQGEPSYAPPRPGDVRHNALNSTKAQQLLGWTPEMTLAQGIALTVDYLRESELSAG